MKTISCDLAGDKYLIWKYPDKNPGFGSQVIISQTQEALLLSSGKLICKLEAGSHTLKTSNIPILKNFIQDKDNSFPFEVWFVNKVSSTDFRWGTKTPIQIKDKEYGLLVPLGSYGFFECSIKDFQAFLLKVVGIRDTFSNVDLNEFLIPLIEREAKDAIADEALSSDVFNISTKLNRLSEKINLSLKEKIKKYGIVINDFYIQSISILSDDPSFEKIKEAMAEAASIKLKAKAVESAKSGYTTERSLDVLQDLASNESGSASAFASAGLGLGAGFNFSEASLDISKNISSKNNEEGYKLNIEKLKDLKELLDIGAINAEEYENKKKKILNEL